MRKESFLEIFIPLEFSTLCFAYVCLEFLNTTLLSVTNLICALEKVTLWCGGCLKISFQLSKFFT